jgi:hypothetical protein
MSEQTSQNHAGEKPLPKEAKPVLGAAHDMLDVFVGEWRGEGKAGDTPMTVEESYARLEGGFFLTTTFDRKVGEARQKGVGSIGYDAENNVYSMHAVDSLGYDRTYELEDVGDTWTLSGDRERATYTFKGDGRLHVLWEHRPDGGAWQPLCEYDLTNSGKARPH